MGETLELLQLRHEIPGTIPHVRNESPSLRYECFGHASHSSPSGTLYLYRWVRNLARDMR